MEPFEREVKKKKARAYPLCLYGAWSRLCIFDSFRDFVILNSLHIVKMFKFDYSKTAEWIELKFPGMSKHHPRKLS